MNVFKITLIVIVAVVCIPSCTVKKNAAEKGDAGTATPEHAMHDNTVLPENFAAYLSHFPLRTLPAEFLFNETNNEGNLQNIDEAYVKQFLSESIVENDTEQLYYLASLPIYPGLFSVVVLQTGYRSRSSQLLINYNEQGEIVSSRVIAHYEAGGGMVGWSSATLDTNGKLVVEDAEEGTVSDELQERKYTFKIDNTGAILPQDIPSGLITSFHHAVKKSAAYFVAPKYGVNSSDVVGVSLSLYKKGDSVLCEPNGYFFNVDSPDSYQWVVDSYTKTKTGHEFTLKDLENPHAQYEALSRLKLIPVEGKTGLYQMVFSSAEPEFAVVTESESDYVVAKENLSVYPKRNIPFVGAQFLIGGEGLNMLWLESSKDHSVREFGEKHKFRYAAEEMEGESQSATRHLLYEENNTIALEVISESSHYTLQSIKLYSPLFKTEGGIGVGSTLKELLYAHEYVSAMCGEGVTIISIPQYKHAYFIVDSVNGPPDTEVDVETLDKNLKITRVDFRK